MAEKLDIFVIVYLGDILIYTKDPKQPQVEALHWILNQLRKYSFFANPKKCWFYQNNVHFLGDVVLSKRKSMKTERIKVVKDWPKPKLVYNIRIFLGFANFYQQFIKSFSKIAAPLNLILIITRLSNKPASKRNDGNWPAFSINNCSKLASSRNDNSRPASSRNHGSKLASNKNDSSKPASSKNYNSRPAFRKNNSNNQVKKFGGDNIKYAKKSENSKGEKLSKS